MCVHVHAHASTNVYPCTCKYVHVCPRVANLHLCVHARASRCICVRARASSSMHVQTWAHVCTPLLLLEQPLHPRTRVLAAHPHQQFAICFNTCTQEHTPGVPTGLFLRTLVASSHAQPSRALPEISRSVSHAAAARQGDSSVLNRAPTLISN